MKKIFSVLFVCAVFVSCEDITKYVDKPVPELISGKPISNAEELAKIGVDAEYPADGQYYLNDDIDLQSGPWTPLGSADSPFTGYLDGNNKKITGLKLNAGDDGTNVYTGLFGYISYAKIEDLSVQIVNSASDPLELKFAGDQYLGTLAAYSFNSSVENISVDAVEGGGIYSIKSGSGAHYAGGVFGCINYGIVKNINSNLAVKAETSTTGEQDAGGITAYLNYGEIINCKSQGNIESNSTSTGLVSAGGIAGKTYGTSWASPRCVIESCVSSNETISAESGGTGAKYAGGIGGYVQLTDIMNCAFTQDNPAVIIANSTGTAAGNVYSGGIAGYVNGTINNEFSKNYVKAPVTIKAESAGTGTVYAGGIGGCTTNNGLLTDESYISVNDNSMPNVVVLRTNDSTVSTNISTYAGGIVGYGTLQNCYSNAYIQITTSFSSNNTSAYTAAGGLAGYIFNGLVEIGYSSGKVEIINTNSSGVVYAGGIAGLVSNSTTTYLDHCFADNGAIVVTSSNSGADAVTANRIAAKKLGANGALGHNYASPGLVVQKIINGSESDIPQENDIDGLCGSSTSGAQNADESFFADTLGWDFTEIWQWDSSLGLPVLR